MDDDADKSTGGDNTRLSVSLDDHDYDIRSEAGASVDGNNKEAEQTGNSGGDGDVVAETGGEGSVRCYSSPRHTLYYYSLYLKQTNHC